MAALNAQQSSAGSVRQASKNRSHSVEKLIKHFPEANSKNKEIDNVLEARRKGSRNDSSAEFFRALNMVNHDPDLALSVKLGQSHADLSDFGQRNTVYQKGLSGKELGKGKKMMKKKGKRKSGLSQTTSFIGDIIGSTNKAQKKQQL